ncbi:MAG: hypothetical protein V3S68_02405 [Dehalococcoidia bacterium]
MPTYNPDHTFVDSTPREIWKAYRKGFPGALVRPLEMKAFLADNPYPLFEFAAPDLEGSGDGKAVVLFPYVLKHDPDAYKAAQKTGDCVSHGTRSAVDLSRVVEIELKGEAEGFYVRGDTTAIYGSRGHGGQGMSCAGAARFVSQTGGILLRKDYTEEFGHDLSSYKGSYKLGMGWGRKGVPAKVVAEAKKHQVGAASLVSSTREVMDALANGYGLSVCSGYGFSSKRDENGVSRRSGSWSHCMCIAGYDDTPAIRKKYGGPIFLIQNSWGKFNSGPKHLNQPDGSFWITERDMRGMVKARGTFVFSQIDGFPPQDLKSWGYNWG